MGAILLRARSNKPGTVDRLLISGDAPTGYRILEGVDWSHPSFVKTYSGPVGTQGAKLVTTEPENRIVTIPLQVRAPTHDALEDLLAVLWELSDEWRRFGGELDWRPEGGSYVKRFRVLDAVGAIDTYGRTYHANNLVNFGLGLVCAPYLESDTPVVIENLSGALPAVRQLDSIIGDAPALAEIAITPGAAGDVAVWALLGWSERPGAPAGGSFVPFGIVEAEAGTVGTGWAVTADVDYRGGSGLQVTTAGAGTANAIYSLDPAKLHPDDQADSVDVELWARVEIASTLVTPRLLGRLIDPAGTSLDLPSGRALVLPSGGTRFRFVRLGIFSLRVDTNPWTLQVEASWAVGSTGTYGLDYLIFVPARRRASSPSGKADDANYPDFVTGTNTKRVYADLSGQYNSRPDHGLGGALLELPTGDVDLLVKLSNLVPDDPTSSAASEQLSHTATVVVTVTPRWHLAAGT